MVNNLKSGRPVNWFDWINKEIVNLCEFYIEIKWCKRHKSKLHQYESLQQTMFKVENQKEYILKRLINKSPEVKQYMMIHSVFGIDDYVNGDWLVKFMINELYPTDKEVKKAHEKEIIPEHILKEFAIFNPQPLGMTGRIDNRIEIHYKMFGDWRKGESSSPINIIDRAWENIGKQVSHIELEEFISSYDNIATC